MTVEPTARYMLKLVADRRGWAIHKDVAGDCSDTFVRGDDRIEVHYSDDVHQSVIYAEQHYGEKKTLTRSARRKKEHVRNWLQELMTPTKEYPDRPPAAPSTSHAAEAMTAFDKAYTEGKVVDMNPEPAEPDYGTAVVRPKGTNSGVYEMSAMLLSGEHIGQKVTVKNPKNGIVYTAYLAHIRHWEGLWNPSVKKADPNVMSVRLRGSNRDIRESEDMFDVGLHDLVTLYSQIDQEL